MSERNALVNEVLAWIEADPESVAISLVLAQQEIDRLRAKCDALQMVNDEY